MRLTSAAYRVGLKVRHDVVNSKVMDLYEAVFCRYRPSDVFLVSFPKSGNTYIRLILCAIELWGRKVEGLVRRPNFFNMQWLVPDIHTGPVTRTGMQTLPRVIKSHRRFTDMYRRIIYVVRDPRSVMASRFRFINRNRQVVDDYRSLIYDTRFGVPAWERHVQSWLESEIADTGQLILVKYEEACRNPESTIQRLSDFLNVEVSDSCVRWVAEVTSKRRMMTVEDRFGRWAAEESEFIRREEDGQARAMSAADEEAIMSEAKDLMYKLDYAE